MRLAIKLTAAVAAILVLAMALFDHSLARKEREIFDADRKRVARLGRAFRSLVELVWQKRGDRVAWRVVDRASHGIDDVGAQIQWVALDRPGWEPIVPADVRDRLLEGDIVARLDRDRNRRVTWVPMRLPRENRAAALVYTESSLNAMRLIQTTRRELVATTALMLLLVAAAILGLGWWLVGRPVAQLRRQAERIGDGDRSARVACRQGDEIGRLAVELNRMAERIQFADERLAEETLARLQAVEQLRHTDRLTTVGQLASGVAHELGTPLNVVSGHAEMIAEGDVDGEGARASARLIMDQTAAMAALIRQLLSLARRTPPEREVLDLRDVALRTIAALEPLARAKGVTLTVEGDAGEAMALAASGHLQQALTNITMNAIQAMPEGGPVRLVVGTRTAAPPESAGGGPPRPCAVVTVVDRGPGIEEEQLDRLFEPFFTTKAAGEGTGLGLPVTDGIVRDHGGWLEVESRVGRGSRFSMLLPLVEMPRAAVSA